MQRLIMSLEVHMGTGKGVLISTIVLLTAACAQDQVVPSPTV